MAHPFVHLSCNDCFIAHYVVIIDLPESKVFYTVCDEGVKSDNTVFVTIILVI